MDDLSNISFLNNTGVACLEEGDLVDAFCFLQQALQAVQLHLNDTPRPSSSQLTDDSNAIDQSSERHLHHQPWWPFVESFHQLIPSRGINISLREGKFWPKEMEKNTTIISAITIYNLGLAFHAKGLQGDNKVCERLLFKAKSFYFYADDLLQKAGVSSAAPRCFSVVHMLSMSILNNLGQIAFHFCHFEQARIYMNQVLDLFLYINNPRDPVAARFLGQSSALFLVNATAFQALRTASAA